MSCGLTLPCPVRLGFVKTGGVGDKLHHYTQEKNLHNVEKLLKQGVDVDFVNNLRQTSLYCASLLGFTSVAELLLRYGADPNHRSDDRSTPVHAAAFSCNTDLLRKLLEAGGDLRLHDNKGKTARDWAKCGAQEGSVKMISFISSCMSVMRSLSESQSLRERDITPTSSKTLLDFVRPVSDMVFNKKLTSKMSVSDTILCFGYEKLCVEKLGKSVGALASVPLISESELSQAEDEALHSFTCGTFTKMTNYSWRGIRITVKELQVNNPHPDAKQHYYHDLLVTELSFCCRLFHPHLLQLMAVSFTNELQQNKLVYERVHVGSLYHLLYHRPAEFPILQAYEVLSLILQVCEALYYLHSRSLVLRSLCSHSVVIVHPGVAKVTGLGFMGPSDCSPFSTPPIPEMLYNWAAPEVIRNKPCTGKADLYSVCALIQELYTDSVPWGSVNPDWIKQAVDAGQALCADPAVPQPYYDLVLIGLQPKAHERTCSLQDLRFLLRSNLRELSEREERREVCPLPASSSTYTLNTALEQNWDPEQPDEQQVVDQDILDYPDMNDCHAEIQSSFSNHISNIVLNLKVCKVLVQETEPCLAVIESRMKGTACSSSSGFDEPDGMKKCREKREVVLEPVGPPSKYCDRMYQSSEECRSQELKKKHQSEHTWTSEVSTAVARVARGFLGAAAGALGGSSDSEEVQEDAQLEQLFKSFAGVESESEESTAFHTITLHEGKGQHQTFDSDEDPDVTMEVCRPYMTAESLFGESFSSPEESQHTEAESVLPSAHTTSHTEDIADLSSITCSPAQLYEQAGQNGAQPRPRSTDVAPCNSTPLSPPTHTGRVCSAPCKEVCVSSLIPHLQYLMETSPWGSTESVSESQSYNTARPDHTDPKHHSVSSVLHSPAATFSPQGDYDTPSSGNPEFTAANSGVKYSDEKRSQDHPGPSGRTDGALNEVKEQEEVIDAGRDSPDLCSSVERNRMPDEDDVLKDKEKRKQLSDAERLPDSSHTAVECYMVNGHSSNDTPEETKRAHTTLDEVLQGFLENIKA